MFCFFTFCSIQGQFEAPLGGITALDLMESFGFEGGLEAVTQEPAFPSLFRQYSGMFLRLCSFSMACTLLCVESAIFNFLIV